MMFKILPVRNDSLEDLRQMLASASSFESLSDLPWGLNTSTQSIVDLEKDVLNKEQIQEGLSLFTFSQMIEEKDPKTQIDILVGNGGKTTYRKVPEFIVEGEAMKKIQEGRVIVAPFIRNDHQIVMIKLISLEAMVTEMKKNDHLLNELRQSIRLEAKDKILNEFNIQASLSKYKEVCHTAGMGLYWDDQYGTFFIVMEALGGSLKRFTTNKEHRFPVDLFPTALLDVFTGLVNIHKENVVHRDIKPANMLLAEDGIKVCDFGCAVKLEDIDTDIVEEAKQGTEHYMPTFEERQSHKTDVYAATLSLLEILLGRKVSVEKHSEKAKAIEGASKIQPKYKEFFEKGLNLDHSGDTLNIWTAKEALAYIQSNLTTDKEAIAASRPQFKTLWSIKYSTEE